MDRDDLLKMLDLAGKEPGPPETATLAFTGRNAAPSTAGSPTVLELDDWGVRRGRELLAESERLQRTGLDEHAIADFHGVAFEPDPRLTAACVDSRRRDFLCQLLDTPDYHVLHQGTLLDPTASEIAATAFAEQFAALHDAEREADSAVTDGLEQEMATLRAVGRALSRATEEVTECKDAAAACGLGPGTPGANDPRAIAELYRRVRNNPLFARICSLAGRYRRLAQSKQRQKNVHGVDDLVGVITGGDIGQLLPHELVKLVDDELAGDALRRLVERQLMCREYHAVEPIARGPIIVCTDESGSMEGDNATTAKALALAMAWVARQQRRWCSLVAYSGDSGERVLALPPGRWDERRLLDWLEEFIGRGSSIDVPVRELPRIYQQLRAPVGKTDLIFITDAQCRLPHNLQERFLHWKQQVQARLITLVIRSMPGDLSAISDEVFTVNSLDVSESGVGRVLSV